MRPLSAALIIATGLSLSACSSLPSNRSVNSVHQPIVTRTNYAIDIDLTADGAIPLTEQRRLSGWFEAMSLRYGDRISIDDPTFSGGRLAQDTVARAVSNYGLLIGKTAPVTTGAVRANSIRVVVSRSTAEVPGCPNWSTKSQSNFKAATGANYGCATNSSLAAMIADPEDLVRGQEAGPTDQDSATKAIKAYRAGSGAAGGR